MGDRDTVGLQRNDVSDNVATSPTIANITSTGSDHSKTISEVDDQEKKINYDSEKQVIPEEKEGGYGWVIVFRNAGCYQEPYRILGIEMPKYNWVWSRMDLYFIDQRQA